jgi:hypothetical protein
MAHRGTPFVPLGLGEPIGRFAAGELQRRIADGDPGTCKPSDLRKALRRTLSGPLLDDCSAGDRPRRMSMMGYRASESSGSVVVFAISRDIHLARYRFLSVKY